MPAAAAGAIISGGLAFGAGTTVFGLSVLASSLLIGASSLVLGGLSMALAKGKKPSSSTNPLTGNNVAAKSPDMIRKIIYGHTRIVTGYANMESTGVNKDLHLIIILCEGQLRSINEIWVNDYVIHSDDIDANGNVIRGRYANNMIIRRHLGATDQTADPVAVANIPDWTLDHRLRGIAYLYVKMTKDQDLYPSGVPNFSAIVEGKTLYDPRTQTNRWSTNVALYARDYLSNDYYGFGVFPEDIDDFNVSAQANICDEMVDIDQKSYNLSAVNPTLDDFTISGDILDMQFGDRVQFTVSGGSLPAGITAGVNYYVIPVQTKDAPRFSVATSLDNSMAKVKVNITSAGSGLITVTKNGEPRYHGSGVIETENTLSQNMNDIVNSMSGRAVCIGGYWTLLAGAWRTPSITFDIGDIRGNGVYFKNDLSMSESYNVIKGLFISSVNQYQPTDYPSIRYQQFVNDDNGLESTKEINLPFTNRVTTAQRIAKIELFRGRQGIVVTSTMSMKGLQVQPGDNIYLDIERLGWENKPFEVTQFSFDVNDGSMVTKLTLRETALEVFDWSAGEAIDFDPAPNTTLPNPFLVMVPSGVYYNSRFVETRDGDAVYTLVLNWLQHEDQFVTQFGDFEVQYKLATETDWRPSFFVDGILTTTDVVSSTVNVYYDLRVRARNNLGVRSGWTTIENAVAGSSGGVGETRNYEHVYDPVVYELDYGSVEDEPTSFEDWGYVV